MRRTSVKIVGASGQGINSTGTTIAKGLKRAGYGVFGYREYPSLITGGHASYQVDASSAQVRSTESKVNLLVALDHHGLELNMEDPKEGGVVVHLTPGWQFSDRQQQLIEERTLRVVYFPAGEVLSRLGAPGILSNVLLTGFMWSILDQDVNVLKVLVGEKFARKTNLLDLNMRCIDEGYSFVDRHYGRLAVALPAPNTQFAGDLLLTGSQAMGLGAIHAGVRLYAGYPMTPSSPLLEFIADLQDETHMVVKQAEDEITAAQLVSGAMYMGTRALTATAGVGFDLMTETLSLNAMIENPMVVVLAQRPGPATGLATWTAQVDLLHAVHTSHGEFGHCVLGVSDSQDAFDLIPVAFNLAEEYQVSVVVLTDKQIADALYTQTPYDLGKAEIRRGMVVSDPAQLQALTASDRYDPNVPAGVSPRWLPGTHAPTYCAQADEHDAAGGVDETSNNARRQMDKRMRKLQALKEALPEPRLVAASPTEQGKCADWTDHGDELDLLVVGWGSTRSVIEDVVSSDELRPWRIAYLHYTYLWPLRTQKLQDLAARTKRIVLVEQNYQGQLGMLLRMECGLEIPTKILKYDGRPFFYDELLSQLLTCVPGEPGRAPESTAPHHVGSLTPGGVPS